MAPSCIDLKETFGRRFKVAREESYPAAYGRRATRNDPWYEIIPGRRGHVFPWDATRLAASTRTGGPTAKRLKALRGVEVWQDGSDGVTVLFPSSLLDQVAELLLLRRRRRLSEAGREQLARASLATRFQPHRPGVQSRGDERPCVAGG